MLRNFGRAILLAFLLAFAGLFVNIAAASAADLTPTVGSGGAVAFTFPLIPFLNLVISVGLPFLVGLLTHSGWSARSKAVLHLALSAVGGLLTELVAALVAGHSYDIGVGLVSAATIFGLGLVTYFGFLKTAGSSGTTLASVLATTGVTNPDPDPVPTDDDTTDEK